MAAHAPHVLLAPALSLLARLALPAKLVLLGLLFAAGAGALAAGWLLPAGTRGAAFALGAACLLAWAWLALAFCVGFIGGLRRLLAQMAQIEAGRLQALQPPPGRDEIAQLGAVLARMTGSLSSVVSGVRSNAALVEQAGRELAASCAELAQRTEQQAGSLQQTATGVQQLAQTVDQNARHAAEADGQAAQVRQTAEDGGRSMDQAVTTVAAIQQDAHRMRELVGVIDGLAFQTNILALNAAVEAARAGEQGRGFAVVAGEVRRLAMRSAEEAGRIRELIEASNRHVDSGVEGIRTAGGGIAGVVEGVRGMAERISRISGASAGQSSGLGRIADAVQALDGITRRNAEMVDEATRQAQLLQQRSATLSSSVAHFQLPQGTADEALALVRKARTLFDRLPEAAALAELTRPGSGFHDRDMYVFALDAGGCYRAFGGNPAKLGTRVHDIPGVDGAALLDAIVRQARRAPGWVEYDIVNPASGQVQTKMSYVLQVGELFLGCGVYQRLAVPA